MAKAKTLPDFPDSRLYTRTFVNGDAQIPIRTAVGDDGERLTNAADLGRAIGTSNVRARLRAFGLTASVRSVYSAGKVRPFQWLTDDTVNRLLSRSRTHAGAEFREGLAELATQQGQQSTTTALANPEPQPITRVAPEVLTRLRAVIDAALAKRDDEVKALRCIVEDQRGVIDRIYEQLRELQIPRRPTTAHVREIVEHHCRRIGKAGDPDALKLAYGCLYREFQDRHHCDVSALAKKKRVSGLKIIEGLGQLAVRQLVALAVALYGPVPVQATLPDDVGDDDDLAAILGALK